MAAMGVVLLTIITLGIYPMVSMVIQLKKQTELLEQILFETKIHRGTRD